MNFRFVAFVVIVMLVLVDWGYPMSHIPEPRQETWEQVPLRSYAQKEKGAFGGEGMQMIFGIAYAYSNPETVYLVSDTSQVWKSTDGGSSWKMKHKGFFSNGGIAIAVDPVNEDIVFAAGSAHRLAHSSHADGIYRSTDGGENWELVKSTAFFRGREGEHFAFNPGSNDDTKTKIVYAGTHKDGLLYSDDGGDNWEVLGFTDKKIIDMETNPLNLSTLFLLTNEGLFKVTLSDGVISQTAKLAQDLKGPFRTFTLNSNNPLIIYIAMGKKGIYKSVDGGVSFHKLKKGLISDLDYIQIALSPANPEHLYISVDGWGGLNPLWSNDSGESWHKPESLDSNNDSIIKGRYFSAPVSPHPFKVDIALTSANGGDRVIKTVDGGINWAYSGNGLTGGRKGVGNTSQAFYDDPEKMIFFLIDYGPFLTVDGGNTFRMLNIPRVNGLMTTPVGAVSPYSKGKLIVTAIGSHKKQSLAISRDYGKSWEIIPGTQDQYKFISFHPQKTNIIYAQGLMSRNSGGTWEPLSQKVFAMFKGNGDIVYSFDNIGIKKSIIKRSDDQGMTWSSPYPYLSVRASDIYEIDVDPVNPDRIYVASQVGLYLYDVSHGKWRERSETSGLKKDFFRMKAFRCIAVDPKHPEVLYAGKWAPGIGHSNGIFRSVDYGNTWENITYNLGLPFNVWSVSISPYDGTVYLGSSHGTWKLPPPY